MCGLDPLICCEWCSSVVVTYIFDAIHVIDVDCICQSMYVCVVDGFGALDVDDVIVNARDCFEVGQGNCDAKSLNDVD